MAPVMLLMIGFTCGSLVPAHGLRVSEVCCENVDGCDYTAARDCDCPNMSGVFYCQVDKLRQMWIRLVNDLFASKPPPESVAEMFVEPQESSGEGVAKGGRPPHRSRRELSAYLAREECCTTDYNAMGFGCIQVGRDMLCKCPANTRTLLPECVLASVIPTTRAPTTRAPTTRAPTTTTKTSTTTPKAPTTTRTPTTAPKAQPPTTPKVPATTTRASPLATTRALTTTIRANTPTTRASPTTPPSHNVFEAASLCCDGDQAETEPGCTRDVTDHVCRCPVSVRERLSKCNLEMNMTSSAPTTTTTPYPYYYANMTCCTTTRILLTRRKLSADCHIDLATEYCRCARGVEIWCNEIPGPTTVAPTTKPPSTTG